MAKIGKLQAFVAY